MISDSLAMAVVMVIVVCLVMNFIDYSVPLYTKLQFNQVCKDYAVIVASEGSLTTDQLTSFKSELDHIGCDDIEISIDPVDSIAFGSPITYEVLASMEAHRQTSLFNRDVIILPFEFETVLIYRKYIN